MTYVLAEQRDRDVVAAFAVYREYLEANKSHRSEPVRSKGSILNWKSLKVKEVRVR